MDYRYGSHTVYNIAYHFVWVTKYRDKVLTGDVALRVRELVRQTCEIFEIKILKGVVSKDHVHILVSAPPHMAPSEYHLKNPWLKAHAVAGCHEGGKRAYWHAVHVMSLRWSERHYARRP